MSDETATTGLRPWFKKKRFVIPIVLITLSIIGRFDSSPSGDSSGKATTTATDSSWIPSGFNAWNSDIAYKWVDATCDDQTICGAIQVVTNRDCPNDIYAELLLQDKNYVQYDYTNDSQGSLKKGSISELTFEFAPDPRFKNWDISKISCV